ncbi:MAG: hypothetical protein AAFR45_08700 [Pseudomonadota bacterium]
MSVLGTIALLSVAVTLCYALVAAQRDTPPPRLWTLPAIVCAAFTLWTGAAVLAEGLFGFWDNHVQSLWGIQVWVDLLIAIAIGWSFLAPRARQVGMSPWPWLAFTGCTGCIGLTAMAARMLYLEEHGKAKHLAVAS